VVAAAFNVAIVGRVAFVIHCHLVNSVRCTTLPRSQDSFRRV
jgi:hypothetical protein